MTENTLLVIKDINIFMTSCQEGEVFFSLDKT